MYMTLTKQQFIREFTKVRPDNFSREALSLLYDCLEDQEFDPIAICCDYSEESITDLCDSLGVQGDEVLNTLEYLTTVIGQTDDGIVYVNY